MVGMVLTMWTGDGSAVQVSRVQPMKLAAMEGLYDGSCGQSLVAFGVLNTDKRPGDDAPAMYGEISIPYGLSLLLTLSCPASTTSCKASWLTSTATK